MAIQTSQPNHYALTATEDYPVAGRASGQLAPEGTQPRPSLLRSIFTFLGWMIAIAMIVTGVVMLGSVWLVSDTTRDIFSMDTHSTVITGQSVVESIQRVNKQVFIEHYNAIDIDYSEAPDGWLGWLPIEQTYVLLLKGHVPAGFNLRELAVDDVWISADGSRVQLTLPPPVIFEENVAVDFEYSRILMQSDTCPASLCQDPLTAFQKEMLPEGKRLLIEASQRSGIMQQAADDGVRYYTALLQSLGFDEVRVFIRGEEQKTTLR